MIAVSAFTLLPSLPTFLVIPLPFQTLIIAASMLQ